MNNLYVQGLTELLGNRTNIGIKRMGELDQKPFLNTCKQRFPIAEVDVEASTLCSLWQENLKDPAWHPFKITNDGGTAQVHSAYFFTFQCVILVYYQLFGKRGLPVTLQKDSMF